MKIVIEPSAAVGVDICAKKVAGCLIRKTASGRMEEKEKAKGRKSPILNFFQPTFFPLSLSEKGLFG